MHELEVKKIMAGVRSGKINVDEAVRKLKFVPFEDLGFAKVDHHRALRKGFPEVIFCQGKAKNQVVEIAKRLARNNSVILATRATEEMFTAVKKQIKNSQYNKISNTIIINQNKKIMKTGKILIASAGTSDMDVAEEAAVVAESMGNKVERIYDVGVAGLHRLLNNKKKIEDANVLIVVAGMDGVLPSVVSGIFGKPIIAVPTSVGYGASFKGIAPLLTMLNSCSPGVVVVNIDNGFGAGYFASMINK
ncbi:nickel pincer cofactor biosynthesis protein LarB [Candidatus Woesearchaeota archaeon]|nr:nickel pincer cofactor biosynthesis protein LarB [Candidatus Woesearchaeota archaeon]